MVRRAFDPSEFVGVLGRFSVERSSRDGHREYRFTNCPFCGYTKKAFYVSEDGCYICYHCEARGTIADLRRRCGSGQDDRFQTIVRAPTRTIPIERYLPLHYQLMESPEALAWLHQRGVFLDTILAHLLGLQRRGTPRYRGVAWDDDYIVIPYADNGVVNLLKYRALGTKKFLREEGMASPLYRAWAVRGAREVHLTEGEFDAMILAQAGYEATCSVPNGAHASLTEEHKETLSAAEKVFIWGDSDPQGREFARRAAEVLGLSRSVIVQLPDGVKDVNDLFLALGRDLDAFRREVERLMATAVRGHVPGFTSVATVLAELSQTLDHQLDRQPVLCFPWPEGTELIDTRPGDVMVLLARTKVGKTTLMKQCFLASARNGRRCLYISAETSAQEMAEMLVSEIANVPRTQITAEHVKNALDELGAIAENMIFGQLIGVPITQSMEIVERAVSSYRPDIVFIDYLQQIVGEEPNQQSEFMGWIVRSVAAKYRCFVTIVSQPRKPAGKSATAPPDAHEARGTSQIQEGATHFLILYRKLKTIEAASEGRDPYEADGYLHRRFSRRPRSEKSTLALTLDGECAVWKLKREEWTPPEPGQWSDDSDLPF